jgi:hypothetical protein
MRNDAGAGDEAEIELVAIARTVMLSAIRGQIDTGKMCSNSAPAAYSARAAPARWTP